MTAPLLLTEKQAAAHTGVSLVTLQEATDMLRALRAWEQHRCKEEQRAGRWGR